MTIKIGDAIPDISLKRLGENGMEDISVASYLANKKIVLFAVPGAYTPGCSLKHLPGYVANAESIKAKGVDEIICISVNDPFVMKAWGESAGAAGKVTMLSDWNAALVSAFGLTFDASGAGLGTRAQRFSMIIENGIVKDLQVEPAASSIDLSSADTCLIRLAA
jgi:glutaredoxin/glutathione-dependent peroxiredoxin